MSIISDKLRMLLTVSLIPEKQIKVLNSMRWIQNCQFTGLLKNQCTTKLVNEIDSILSYN